MWRRVSGSPPTAHLLPERDEARTISKSRPATRRKTTARPEDAMVHVPSSASVEISAKPARSTTRGAAADREGTAHASRKTNADTTQRVERVIVPTYDSAARSVSIMRLFIVTLAASAITASTVAEADTHRFMPEKFYNTYSFAHPPALRIKPGDRVVTRTIDAAGTDLDGKSVGSGPNPQTGPFFIEGAEPGDMLVVSIEKIETNRTMAYSSSLLAPYAVDPGAIATRVDREPRRVTWTIDKARGVARLDQADVQPGGIELPLRPMLGCIGVAPARKEAISTAAPGAFGGNMDYAWMNAGVKLMLPVNEPGALLFLGDGH